MTPESVRTEVRQWLAHHWDPDLALVEWRTRLLDSGWAVPSWPTQQCGRGLPPWADRIVAEEIETAGAVGLPLGSGVGLAIPTLVAHADAELLARLVRPTLIGEMKWCQLFSEPGAGSDLASLTTTAVRDGDEWVVDGQKVWTTGAQRADVAMLLARTEPAGSKHAGITYFVLPMRQPGVEVRPILQMNGHASFNAVFLTAARIPATDIVGAQGDGWRIGRTTLSRERSFATLRRARIAAGSERALVEARAEAEAHFATYAWYPQRAGRAELVAERAKALGVADVPVVREVIGGLHAFVRANEWTAARASAARELGQPPGRRGRSASWRPRRSPAGPHEPMGSSAAHVAC